MAVVIADGYRFDFTDAINAFIFDETDKTKLTYHGAPMKAVDIVAEFAEFYVYVELKDYDDVSEYDVKNNAVSDIEKADRNKRFKWLKNYLKYKYRDTYIYRTAEQKIDKPIRYICLINFDNALNNLMMKNLQRELPVGNKLPRRWQQSIALSCHVVNLAAWNRNYTDWPAIKLP